MPSFLPFRRSCSYVFFAPLVLCVLAWSMPRDVSAQGRKDSYTIVISKEQNACFYEIQIHADQDLFRITPGGFVHFQATGTKARVVIEKDNGVGGTAGPRKINLRDGGPGKRLTARGRRGGNTQHLVHIRCCDRFRIIGPKCSNAQDAEPKRGSFGALEFGQPGGGVFEGVLDVGGPRVPEVLGTDASGEAGSEGPEGVGTGGPTMEVDEDG